METKTLDFDDLICAEENHFELADNVQHVDDFLEQFLNNYDTAKSENKNQFQLDDIPDENLTPKTEMTKHQMKNNIDPMILLDQIFLDVSDLDYTEKTEMTKHQIKNNIDPIILLDQVFLDVADLDHGIVADGSGDKNILNGKHSEEEYTCNNNNKIVHSKNESLLCLQDHNNYPGMETDEGEQQMTKPTKVLLTSNIEENLRPQYFKETSSSKKTNFVLEQEVDNVLLVKKVKEEVNVIIANIVCTFSVNCHLNLQQIAQNSCDVILSKGMLTMKLRYPCATAKIYSNGKVLCTGTKTEKDAKIAARRFTRRIQKLGFEVRINRFKITTVLASCLMPFSILVIPFTKYYKDSAEWEPELHPGVIFKMRIPKAHLNIFSTGSITISASSTKNIKRAVDTIIPLVCKFHRKRTDQDLAHLKELDIIRNRNHENKYS